MIFKIRGRELFYSIKVIGKKQWLKTHWKLFSLEEDNLFEFFLICIKCLERAKSRKWTFCKTYINRQSFKNYKFHKRLPNKLSLFVRHREIFTSSFLLPEKKYWEPHVCWKSKPSFYYKSFIFQPFSKN